MLSQQLQATYPIAVRRFKLEMRRKRFHFHGFRRKPHALKLVLLLGTLSRQHFAAQLMRSREPSVDPSKKSVAHCARQHEGGDQSRATDAQSDFLHPGDSGIEDRLRRQNRRESDQRNGVSGQHEEVAARGSVDEGQVKAKAHPD
jgi:hypothetical protein